LGRQIEALMAAIDKPVPLSTPAPGLTREPEFLTRANLRRATAA
jgi:hypothetical protein